MPLCHLFATLVDDHLRQIDNAVQRRLELMGRVNEKLVFLAIIRNKLLGQSLVPQERLANPVRHEERL
ncbi:hypothetical protein D3C73_940690 [compost metagenome]